MGVILRRSSLSEPGPIGSTTPGTAVFTTLQLSTSGPLFRSTSGTIEARNAANDAAAPFTAGVISAPSVTINGRRVFIQQAIPTSPVTGDRWDEVDGSGLHVNSWYYDGTDWIETQVRYQSFPDRGASATTSFAEMFFPAGRMLIRRISYGFSVTATYTSTDYWTVQLRTRIPADPTDYSSTLITINGAVTPSLQTIITPNQKTASGDTQLHQSWTRFGSAATLGMRSSIQFSFIR